MFKNIRLGEHYKVQEKEAEFFVDNSLFPVSIIMKALYTFIDDCFVFMTKKTDGLYVQIAIKDTCKKTAEQLLWDISNSLIHALLMEEMTENNRKIREEIVTHALGYSLKEAVMLENSSGPSVSSEIDTLLNELDQEFEKA